MHRRLTALLVTVVMTVMLVAAPAFADKGGIQHEGSCGVEPPTRLSRMRPPQGRPSTHGSLPQRPVAPVMRKTKVI